MTLIFCGGMPIALPMAMVALIITLFLDKYMILRFYNKSRIEMLDGTLIRIVVRLLPVAIIFHLIITIYIYGCVDRAGMRCACDFVLRGCELPPLHVFSGRTTLCTMRDGAKAC